MGSRDRAPQWLWIARAATCGSRGISPTVRPQLNAARRSSAEVDVTVRFAPVGNTSDGSTSSLTNGANLVVDALEANGVKHMYGVVGIPVTDLARLAQARGIRYIGFRHEASAG